MIRRLLMTLVMAVALFSTAGEAHAGSLMRTSGSIGIGLGQGYASGLSGKYVMADMMAVQATVGTHAFGRHHYWHHDQRQDGISVGADLLFLMPIIHSAEHFALGWNLGFGPGVSLWNSGIGMAVEAVAGLEMNLKVIPLDIVLEYRPGLGILPEIGLGLGNFGAHIRFYF